MNIKNILPVLAAIGFICIIGAGTYEHVATVPRWSAAPPMSLSMFQGQYAVESAPFWQSIHPVTLLLLIASLVANWKTVRRRSLLVTIGGYVLVLALTFTYYVPELLDIIQTPFQASVNEALQARAKTWEKLSLARMVFMYVLAVVLLTSLTKQPEPVVKQA